MCKRYCKQLNTFQTVLKYLNTSRMIMEMFVAACCLTSKGQHSLAYRNNQVCSYSFTFLPLVTS